MSLSLTRRSALMSAGLGAMAMPATGWTREAANDAGALADQVEAFVTACMAAWPDQPALGIAVVKDGQAVGIGCGQQNRRDAGHLAAVKADGRAVGGAYASDAFFPFPDGLDAATEAGATCVIQPGGSIRDEEVVAAADAAGLAMVFTSERHFRH